MTVTNYAILIQRLLTHTIGYDSDTDDDVADYGDGEELQKSPPAKRQKLESGSTASGSSPLSGNVNQDTSCLPFFLTTVRGIPSDFNTRNMAVSIKGMYAFGINVFVNKLSFF